MTLFSVSRFDLEKISPGYRAVTGTLQLYVPVPAQSQSDVSQQAVWQAKWQVFWKMRTPPTRILLYFCLPYLERLHYLSVTLSVTESCTICRLPTYPKGQIHVVFIEAKRFPIICNMTTVLGTGIDGRLYNNCEGCCTTCIDSVFSDLLFYKFKAKPIAQVII